MTDNNFKYPLSFFYAILPQKVRLISRTMGLDYTFDPNDAGYYDPEKDSIEDFGVPANVGNLFLLAKTKLFDHIYVYLGEESAASCHIAGWKKREIIGWIDLMQFHYEADDSYNPDMEEITDRSYRIGYDAMFISPDKKITYQGKQYEADISLDFVFKFFDDKGQEILFREKENPDPYIRFYFDKEKGYQAVYKEGYDPNFPIIYEPDYACIWEDPATPVNIPFEDAVKLLKEYFELYDTSDNRPAQNTSYFAVKVEKRE